MDEEALATRISGQFAGESDRSDIWQGLGYVLETDAYLNLGHSPGYRMHLQGSPQGRLVEFVLERLRAYRPIPTADRLLDLGCGRGVPTRRATTEYGFDAVGVDLVTYNVERARENARDVDRPPAFVVGDASRLPFDSDAFDAGISIDAIVYVPALDRVYDELARVLVPSGHAVVSDLVAVDGVVARTALERFARAWDMPPPRTMSTYRRAIEGTNLAVLDVIDVSAASVAGFRKWSRLFLALADGPTRPIIDRTLAALEMDPAVVTEQVRAAHEALPALRHLVFVLRAR